MEKVKKQAKIWLCISIALMLLSMIVVSCVQTDGGKVKMTELNFVTTRGTTMSAYLLVPENATAETPAPAIVCSHGYLNNKEMTDANYVELARRGYVVLAIDQPCHGDSEVIEVVEPRSADGAYGVYQGALLLSELPYVDKDKIGVTGHSMGGNSCTFAILEDNASEEPIISAVMYNSRDPYTDTNGEYSNIYGSRDVGVMSCEYDEFMHGDAPNYLSLPTAQSFLHFGKDPSGLDEREANTIYTESVDGTDCIRVIYREPIIHPWAHFSSRSTSHIIDFFDNAFGAPNPIDSSNQIWQWKEAFNFVGFVGMMIFIVSFGALMVQTPVFAPLCANEIAKPVKVADGKGKLWFWLSLIAGALFSSLIYIWILSIGTTMRVSQPESMGLGLWSTLCGLFTILTMIVFYYGYGKKQGMDLVALGVKMPAKKLGLSVLLGVIIAVMAYVWVFAADYFFYADFRIWTLAIKAFDAPILRYLPYGLLFITYYVANSVATNCFNYNDIGGKTWINTIIVALFAAFPALVLPWMQYATYYSTGAMLWPASAMSILWLFPIVLILFFSTVINRLLYRVTKNPYIAGVVNAIIVTLLTISNTCTTLI